LIQTHHAKYCTILGLLLLCAIRLSTTEDSLYAQINSDESSSDADDSVNNDDDSSGSSSKSDDDDDNDSSGSSDSSDTVDYSDSDEQTNDMTMSEVKTNPLSDVIIHNVTNELTAAGITDLGF
jgi:hypothetical protein